MSHRRIGQKILIKSLCVEIASRPKSSSSIVPAGPSSSRTSSSSSRLAGSKGGAAGSHDPAYADSAPKVPRGLHRPRRGSLRVAAHPRMARQQGCDGSWSAGGRERPSVHRSRVSLAYRLVVLCVRFPTFARVLGEPPSGPTPIREIGAHMTMPSQSNRASATTKIAMTNWFTRMSQRTGGASWGGYTTGHCLISMALTSMSGVIGIRFTRS